MAKKTICPLCENGCVAIDTEQKGGHVFSSFSCRHLPRMFFLDQILLKSNLGNIQFYQTMIFDDLLRRSYREFKLPHYSLVPVSDNSNPADDFINAAALPCWSSDHVEKIDRALMNIYLMWGDKMFELRTKTGMRCLLSWDDEGSMSMENSLVNFGYISPADSPGAPGEYIISKEGWQRITELRSKETDRTGFIAIAFNSKTSRIRKTLKEAISESGFTPILIDEVEHNHQIVPEIIDKTGRCRFLVMDCTDPNLGAYYEAGVARGLGKEVIICCRKKEFEKEDTRPHFDVNQQSMVIWTTHENLKSKLVNRIKGTVEGATVREEWKPKVDAKDEV